MDGDSAASTATIADVTPASRGLFRLTIGKKIGLFFVVFLAVTYVNFHIAALLFESLGSSAHIVNETGRLRYLSQKIAYLASREDPDKRLAIDKQIGEYDRVLSSIEDFLEADGRSLLKHNPTLRSMLDGLHVRWRNYANAVRALTEYNLDSVQHQEAFTYLHNSADEMLISADAIVNALTETDKKMRHQAHQQLDGALILEALFLLIIFLFMQRGVSRPLRQLTDLFRNFAAGEHSVRMRFFSRDEVGELAHSFNHTAETISALIHDLNGRTREATLLHRVAIMTQQDNMAIDAAIEQTARLLPEGWQYPEVTGARITHGNTCHQSSDFKESPWYQQAALICNDGMPIRLEIFYHETHASRAASHFPATGQQALEDVTSMLKSFIDRINAQHTQNRLLAIFESTTDLVGSFHPNGAVFYLNQAARRLFCVGTPETGRMVSEFHPPWALTQHQRVALPMATQRGIWSGETAMLTPDGRELPMSETLIAHHNTDGALSHYSFIARDIADRIELEQRLTRSRDFYLSLFHDFPDLIWRSNLDGHADYFNRTWLTFTGQSFAQLQNSKWEDALHPDDREEFLALIRYALVTHEGFEIEYRLRHAAGEYRWMLGHCRPYQDIEGNFAGLICSSHDITERKRIADDLTQLANFDYLTSLPNRTLLKDRVDQALVFALRQQQQVAVMFLDLDRFKNINDTLGHDIGDRLLIIAAQRLRTCLREGDTVARLGGDEFVIVLPNIVNEDDWQGVAEKLLDVLRTPYRIDHHELYVTGSLGISLYPRDGTDYQTLLKHADIAMYRAKEEGHDCHRQYTKGTATRMRRRLTLESQLQRALENDEFTLHYQPQVAVNSGRITGLEALIRWQNPELGLVSPIDFIPLAEETGLIVPIGEWVLHTACRQNLAWQMSGFAPVRVAVNLSARQFRRQDIVKLVTHTLATTGLNGCYLDIELTESMLMHNPERVIETLYQLKALNVRIALDDFGTGYSSLAYLKRFPIDEIKIDKSFVRDVSSNPEDAAIVQAIMGIARNLGLSVVAEGVETVEQLEYLRNCNCERVQGYLFSRPVPAGEIPVLLSATTGITPR